MIQNASHSFTPVCDTRTGLSLGSALLATVIVAVALGVLAHLGYISPVIAYTAGPIGGILLLLIGMAAASIRAHEGYSKTEEPAVTREDQAPLLGVVIGGRSRISSRELCLAFDTRMVSFTDGSMIKTYPPDATHPYHYRVIRLGLEEAFMDVEVVDFRGQEEDSIEQASIILLIDNRQCSYVLHYEESEVESEIQRSLQEKIFDNRLYERFQKHNFRTECFLTSPVEYSPGEHIVTFKIPNLAVYRKINEPNQDDNPHPCWIFFIISQETLPLYPTEGFDTTNAQHGKIVELLNRRKWEWLAPGTITKSAQLSDGTIEVTYVVEAQKPYIPTLN